MFNITSTFLVPTLGIPKEYLMSGDFINGYVKDEGNNVEHENSVYLLFKPKKIEKFREFLDKEYERTKSIIEDYDYKGGYVVVVYKLDMTYKKDFALIRKGKYSQTSDKFQQLFPMVVKIRKGGLHKDELSLQRRIFNKTPDLIEFWEKEFDMNFDEEWEVWRGWKEEDEILNIKKIKKDVK